MIAVQATRSDTATVPLKNRKLVGPCRPNKIKTTKLRRSRSTTRKIAVTSPASFGQRKPIPPAAPAGDVSKSTRSLGRSGRHVQKSNGKLVSEIRGKPTGKYNSSKNDEDSSVKLPRIAEGRKTKSSQSKRSTSAKSTTSSTSSSIGVSNTKNKRQDQKAGSREDGSSQKKKSKSVYILEAIKPNNVESEKVKFMRLRGCYNPQFEYDHLASEKVMRTYSRASNKLIPQAMKIMENALEKYGSYEAFEEAIAGKKISQTEFTWMFKNFISAEGLENKVQLNLTPDLLSRAVMTRLRSRPTMNVNSKVLREGWTTGLLQHEIGTHYIRSANGRYQPWGTNRGRKRHNLLPMNPTEEGLASLHSVLGRRDPCLWRSAMLYFAVYQASRLSFSELFEDLGRFIRSTEVRWDYCMRAKRGQVDTSLPGCFNKDQVYLNGALQILRFRHEIDFHTLVKLGRVAYQDVERLRKDALLGADFVSVPSFMADLPAYLQQLNEIRIKNHLTDKELCDVFPSMEGC